ncbi:MAG: copper resistance protein NlpE [Alistipes senegalensis]|nr:copper resistance protein NlpE [Bacteroides cellulosilyticus]MCM1352201.1 copper resistance protein NlpE [Alistipes senegalensis]
MIRIFVLLSTLLALVSCIDRKSGSATVSSETKTATAAACQSIYGTYTGTIPAADCPGIAITLTIFDDGSYTLRSEYLERNAVFNEQGRFTIEDDRLTLYPDEGEPSDSYRIENNQLRMLDSQKQPITGALAEHYVL